MVATAATMRVVEADISRLQTTRTTQQPPLNKQPRILGRLCRHCCWS
jgi:hypothetical protein